MSLDSILENPSLKNMILNNSVRDFQGYLTGFSSNNFLETFAPQEVLNAIGSLEAKRKDSDAVANAHQENAENEAAKAITSRLLNTSIGAFYLKDILTDGNIIDDVVNQKLNLTIIERAYNITSTEKHLLSSLKVIKLKTYLSQWNRLF